MRYGFRQVKRKAKTIIINNLIIIIEEGRSFSGNDVGLSLLTRKRPTNTKIPLVL